MGSPQIGSSSFQWVNFVITIKVSSVGISGSLMADVRGSTRWSTSTIGLRRKVVPFSEWMEDSKGHYLLLQLPNFKKGEVNVEVNDSAGHVTISGERQVNKENESGSSEEEEEEEDEFESFDEEESESDQSSEDEMYFVEIKNEFEYFEEKFSIPPNSDANMITAKLEGETLYIIIPKIGATENDTQYTNVQGLLLRPENDGHYSNILLGNGHVLFSLENIRKWDEHEDGVLRMAMEMLSKQKRMVLTAATAAAVVAFSLGMLVSHQTFQSRGGE
ncbi:PREDICTED: inactive RESTRICTED TEV MOVEMENT [Prunus dulcis]|uniref:PREDICTED: inactive RESTRICTED TEV MOVEMENT n=1 Tax=Prunus dulcis TaxID=3755 RepID=A0A5E4EMX7_PRUDU|nr:uncharacterized protein LOC117626989 [Prunus dulcis]VVA17053.1 PREDICTED: inactive RESTRICTED TEV MOVEMENT [Prunus dulcis]